MNLPLSQTSPSGLVATPDPWEHFHSRTGALPKDPYERYLVLRDPWFFLSHCVFTRDQVDIHASVKPAPADRPYLFTLTRLFQREPLLAVLKSRRMWISWWAIAVMLHDAITHQDRDIYFVSKKEPDADELVRRARFIHDSIPRSIWHDQLLPKAKYKENHLEFPSIRSGIHAVASGADQLRQFTASGILMDEMSFWPDCRETYTAAKPTIEGGGRVLIISTPSPKVGTEPPFFHTLVYDKIT